MRIIYFIALLLIAAWRMDAAVVSTPTIQVVTSDSPAGSPSNFTNAVNRFNVLSIDGVRRTIHMAPGTFALATGSYRLHVSNNICIKGAGAFQTIITGLGGPSDPIIYLYDNCELSDLSIQSSGTGPNPQVGYVVSSPSMPSSTNVVLNRVWLKGDDDNLWLSIASTYYDPLDVVLGGVQISSFEWTVNDSLFENRFDSVFVEGTENGDFGGSAFTEDGPAILRIFNSRLVSSGPSLDAASRARGDVTNIRLLGRTARAEVYGSYLHSSGGTNVTAIAFLGSAPSGANPDDRWPGGLYLNNCQVQIIGTNLVTGGVGACLLQTTNGWAFLNGIQANSNNIIGTGTNFYSAPINRGWADNVSLTADNQAVSPRLSKYIKLSSDNGTAGNRTFTIVTAFLKQGDIITLEWVGTNAGELVDDAAMTGGGNARLSATWTPTQYDTLTLEFNGTDLIERGRSTN